MPPTVDEYGGGDFGGAVLGPDEVLVDVHGGDDDDVNNDNDYRENHDQSNTRPYAGDDRGEEDPEVSFKSTLKVTRSPREDVDSSPARDTKRTTLSQRTRSTRAPSRRGVRSGLEPLVDLKTSTSGMGEAHDFYRRSKRQKIAPLAFWRNEKVIYGRRQSARMPVIVDVLRKDAAQSPTKQPARHQSSRQKKKRAIEAEGKLREVGFRPKVSVEAAVIDYDTHELTQRRTPLALLFIDDTCWLLVLALGSDQVKAKTVNGEDFAIQTIFTEGTFLSSGILEFPPKSSKPSRNSSKHVLVPHHLVMVIDVLIHANARHLGLLRDRGEPGGHHQRDPVYRGHRVSIHRAARQPVLDPVSVEQDQSALLLPLQKLWQQQQQRKRIINIVFVIARSLELSLTHIIGEPMVARKIGDS